MEINKTRGWFFEKFKGTYKDRNRGNAKISLDLTTEAYTQQK